MCWPTSGSSNLPNKKKSHADQNEVITIKSLGQYNNTTCMASDVNESVVEGYQWYIELTDLERLAFSQVLVQALNEK